MIAETMDSALVVSLVYAAPRARSVSAFCSWLCPTMLIDRIRDFFRS